jgi:hypothetical protein
MTGIGVLVLSSFTTGFLTGWLLRMILVMAEISRSQERMQKKVRYWQGEAAHARAVAERFAGLLEACAGQMHGQQDRPPTDVS